MSEHLHEISREIVTNINDILPSLDAGSQEKAVETRDLAKRLVTATQPAHPNLVVQGYRQDFTFAFASMAERFWGVDLHGREWDEETLNLMCLYLESTLKKAQTYQNKRRQLEGM